MTAPKNSAASTLYLVLAILAALGCLLTIYEGILISTAPFYGRCVLSALPAAVFFFLWWFSRRGCFRSALAMVLSLALALVLAAGGAVNLLLIELERTPVSAADLPWGAARLRQEVSKTLALDLKNCTIAAHTDTHGGFHGDGETVAIFTWEDKSAIENQITRNDAWKPLPLPDELTAVFYGLEYEKDGMTYGLGPLAADEDRTPLFPTVENGYYFFLDRSDESRDQHSTEGLWDRYSFNFTAALYDTDSGALYYYALDT
ncbi:MAG TPA: hypothetical protein H9682_04025 [Firmicutes bacterium]|nr:hypothetical protein [Bacillota bacterium]